MYYTQTFKIFFYLNFQEIYLKIRYFVSDRKILAFDTIRIKAQKSHAQISEVR